MLKAKHPVSNPLTQNAARAPASNPADVFRPGGQIAANAELELRQVTSTQAAELASDVLEHWSPRFDVIEEELEAVQRIGSSYMFCPPSDALCFDVM